MQPEKSEPRKNIIMGCEILASQKGHTDCWKCGGLPKGALEEEEDSCRDANFPWEKAIKERIEQRGNTRIWPYLVAGPDKSKLEITETVATVKKHNKPEIKTKPTSNPNQGIGMKGMKMVTLWTILRRRLEVLLEDNAIDSHKQQNEEDDSLDEHDARWKEIIESKKGLTLATFSTFKEFGLLMIDMENNDKMLCDV